jgi:hypothetical protein
MHGAGRRRVPVTPQPTLTDPDSAGDTLALSRLFENLADEMSVATAICVNVEEIIADRMIDGAPDSDFAQVELQNVDRLIQMLTDFRTLMIHLGGHVGGTEVSREACRQVLVMEDLRHRLLATEPTRTKTGGMPSSDVTFF